MPILLFFIETKIGRTIAITGLIIIGILIGWLIFKTHYYNQGWAAAIHAIAAQDQKAINAAQQARETVKACRDSGHVWDVANGVCG
jgi:predicted negative regulator of RcsB-dependent stress response